MWDLIVSVPDHCLPVYFTKRVHRETSFMNAALILSECINESKSPKSPCLLRRLTYKDL